MRRRIHVYYAYSRKSGRYDAQMRIPMGSRVLAHGFSAGDGLLRWGACLILEEKYGLKLGDYQIRFHERGCTT